MIAEAFIRCVTVQEDANGYPTPRQQIALGLHNLFLKTVRYTILLCALIIAQGNALTRTLM